MSDNPFQSSPLFGAVMKDPHPRDSEKGCYFELIILPSDVLRVGRNVFIDTE